MPRIVSLIPSATEIVDALGYGDDLVGRSHECDHPPGVEALPALTAPKVPLEGSSREIDDRVRTLLDEAMSVYDVDEERLNALRPDLILTQSQCEVCAVSLPTVEQAVADRMEGDPTVVALEPRSLADVRDDIRRVAEALGCPERGDRVVRRMRDRMQTTSNSVTPADTANRPTVAALEWIDPLMGAGGWVPTLLEAAGGTPVFAHRRGDLDALHDADPDRVVVMACGFGLPRTDTEMDVLRTDRRWATLRAVQAGHVYLTDGNHFFNRPGPRLATSLDILAEILHPDRFHAAFDRSYRETAWRNDPAPVPSSTQ
ncbi:ABC transporter substrate-binding protein [Salinibacter grassmerensis]|uniref:ABC transporter substrate-binding protein n=1 Tax=Salinibacter grassmerensis TaxID=3040353 RepID=UPI0021E8D270|nr:ABC transporter substrate-binding protein [Salinibacter grassmerensis]